MKQLTFIDKVNQISIHTMMCWFLRPISMSKNYSKLLVIPVKVHNHIIPKSMRSSISLWFTENVVHFPRFSFRNSNHFLYCFIYIIYIFYILFTFYHFQDCKHINILPPNLHSVSITELLCIFDRLFNKRSFYHGIT